jgi:hypothetical protein
MKNQIPMQTELRRDAIAPRACAIGGNNRVTGSPAVEERG